MQERRSRQALEREWGTEGRRGSALLFFHLLIITGGAGRQGKGPAYCLLTSLGPMLRLVVLHQPTRAAWRTCSRPCLTSSSSKLAGCCPTLSKLAGCCPTLREDVRGEPGSLQGLLRLRLGLALALTLRLGLVLLAPPGPVAATAPYWTTSVCTGLRT